MMKNIWKSNLVTRTSEVTVTNKIDDYCEFVICHYWYFLGINVRFYKRTSQKLNSWYVPKRITTTNRTFNRTYEGTPERFKKSKKNITKKLFLKSNQAAHIKLFTKISKPYLSYTFEKYYFLSMICKNGWGIFEFLMLELKRTSSIFLRKQST